LLPVGKIVYYNPSTDPTAPEGKAVNAGTFRDFSTAYVGIGYAKNCTRQKTLPARISTEASSPGAFMSCGNEMFNGTNASYIEASAGDHWVMTDHANLFSVKDAVIFHSKKYYFMFGRANVTDDGYTYQVVGKVHINVGNLGLWFSLGMSTNYWASNFEVLACR
jgi:hypothetical protein